MTISLSSLALPTIGNLFPPPSQKAGDRPISFFLVDGTQSTQAPPTTGISLSTLASLASSAGSPVPSNANTQAITLSIRPEELTRSDPSRIQVQQTLGGAWIDDWGPGIAQINISGHTGWRGNATTDGMTLFANLKKMVYTDFHAKRLTARTSGKDPSLVTLTFCDALDSFTENVVPMTFRLRRSKSRPLLMQYDIQMISLGPASKPPTQSLLGGLLNAAGLTSLGNAVNNISNAISSAVNFVQKDILGPVQQFMSIAVGAFNSVIVMVNAGTGLITSVIDTAKGIAQTGAQVFQTLASVATLPSAIAAQVMSVAGAFTNVFCLISNMGAAAQTYPDYSPLLGASNCSSTAGGEPASQYTLSNTNPFYDVLGKPSTPPVSISSNASQALATINLADPVLSPLTPAQIAANLNVVNSGIKIAA